MKYLPLLWSGLRRKPVRTVLTLLSVTAAFVLFGILEGVLDGLDGLVSRASGARLHVMNRTSILDVLPIAYEARIARVPGVRATSRLAFFVGYYREPKNGIDSQAVDVDAHFAVSTNYRVPEEQRAAMRSNRIGLLVGDTVAKRFGWNIGDRVTLHSNVWVNGEGSLDWPFEIVGFVNAGAADDQLFANALFMNYDYLDSTRTFRKGTAHQFVVAIDDASRSAEIAGVIDAMFANSSAETTTLNERDWVASLLREAADFRLLFGSIVGAVLFTLLFLTGSTMSQSVRDRLPEFSVLKALGFGDATIGALIALEAAVLGVIGAAAGMAIAAAAFPSVFKGFGVPPEPLSPSVYVFAVIVALLLAGVSAVGPMMRARSLSVAEGLNAR